MPFENENLFLAAVKKYKRSWPGDTSIDAAIQIEDTFLDWSAPKKVALSVFERVKIVKAVFEYRKAVEKRASLGFLERLVTPDVVKAEAHSLTVDQIVEHVRGSEMTINFDASEFFSGKFDPGTRYLHMWERGKTVDNDDYAAKRNVTEQAIFCYDHRATQPSDRPYYAGINIGRRTQGSAGNSTYGFSHFVLKEDVKERATFTPSDTFNIASYIITDAAIRSLRGKIPDPVVLQLDAI